ncbi:MAG: ABC transporter substrate-binding protein [Anaerolineae bacterium]|nr:ABC transporter substrate-binding protein [Anaerolineae bacterium]
MSIVNTPTRIRSFVFAILLVLTSACQSPSISVTSTAPTKVNLCYSAISVSQSTLLYAAEKGLFKKHNIEPNLVFINGGPAAATALVAGQVDMCGIAGSNIINTAASGSDLALIGGLINIQMYSLVVRPEIKNISDLKGKPVAIAQPGGSSDISMRAVLTHLGLKPDTDVTLLSIGGQRDRSAAMDSGAVFATLVSPPETIEATARGHRVLFDMADLKLPYQHTAVATSRKFLKENRGAAINVMKAISEAIAMMKKDKSSATEIIAKFYKLDPVKDANSIEEAYSVVVLKYLEQIPYPTQEGIRREIVSGAASNPNMSKLKAEDVIDLSIIQDLEKSGFFTTLYK